MKKGFFIFSIFISIFLLCSCKENPPTISLNMLLNELSNQNIHIMKSDESTTPIFSGKLQNQKPHTYIINNQPAFIYVFSSPKNRVNGLKEFETATESMNLANHSIFQKDNILIFYVPEFINEEYENTKSLISEALLQL